MPTIKNTSFSFENVRLAPNEQIGLHRQPTWELSYITFGSGIRIIGDMTEPFRHNEVIMIPPEIPHCWFFNNKHVNKDNKISNITITFTQQFIENCSVVFPELREHIKCLKEISNAIKFSPKRANHIALILRNMCNQDDIERLASMIKLLSIISTTDNSRIVGMYKSPDKKQDRLNMIRTYIICNATRNISLNDAARYAGMSKSAFCIFFKQSTRKTFVTYLNEYRIELACQLLQQKNMPVSEICYQVGFTDIPYFNRAFKRIKGCSPTKFRKCYCLKKDQT